MTIVGTVMRKLVHMAYGALKYDQPFYSNYLDNIVLVKLMVHLLGR